ncbi:MAG: DUF4190 domain-containing protein [Ruminococcus sp.]|nr:DUF4190 domain-containing protein [Ruminococcus sp.]
MNEDFFYNKTPEIPEKKPEYLKTGLAIASFIISVVNFLFFRMVFSFILAPISLVLGIMSLVKHQGGKGFAITGIVISTISLIVFILFMAIFVKIYPDMEYFIRNDMAIISEFEETGEIPEQFEKYKAPEYDKYWVAFGGEFEDFLEYFITVYKQSRGVQTIPDSPAIPEEDDGEELVVLEYSLHGTGALVL